MTDSTVPGVNGDAGDNDINSEIANMDKEFQSAIQAQMAITTHKTEDDSKLDASKQRPQ
jgi:hypothetical protein